jgi:hypothetical protein
MVSNNRWGTSVPLSPDVKFAQVYYLEWIEGRGLSKIPIHLTHHFVVV